MIVYKSDKTYEEYDADKVRQGICEAYNSIGEPCQDELIESIVRNLYIYERISSKEIRRQVEESLMSINKKVARAYMEKFEKDKELKDKDDFIKEYIKASNASTGSKYDSNANVSNKNVVTLGQELYKINNIRQNRYIMENKIKSSYSKKLAKQYIEDLLEHVLYKHDETAIPGMPYCVAISMYNFLIDGLTKLGGVSKAPTDLKSFCGEFINLVYSVSSQFAGAVATPEYLMYMDYFIRKDYGNDYLNKLQEEVEFSSKHRTLEKVIENCFQQVVHSMNMPAGNRGYQTVFWNIGYFDENYFNGVFGDFVFPDGSKPVWTTLSWLQKKFMKWFNEERTRYVLTFPVETMAMLTDGHDVVDKEYADFTAQMWAEGHSFFCYLSDSPDSLSSCCRLRNSLKDTMDEEHNHTTHQFSMGTASVATGSKSVMTINLNRVVQNAVRKYFSEVEGKELPDSIKLNSNISRDKAKMYEYIRKDVNDITERVHKYQKAFNDIIKDFFNANMLDVYTAGFIDMKKQYLTVGVNGLTDAAEFLDIDINLNDEYKEFVNLILETINKSNRQDRTKECMYNTEFVPGENLSNKNRNWDKKDGYYVSPKHIMYSSYFFNPEDDSLSLIDKMKLHGKDYVQYLDGGQALHANIKEHLSFEQYRQLLRIASEEGCSYFTFNCKNTVCNDCGYISKHTLTECPHCKGHNLDYLTRIIGYLKRVSSFSEPRQQEEHVRDYI
jgi:ribonucleoside-triphosphate reductase (formate)